MSKGESWHAYNADGPRIFKCWSITDGCRKIATVAEQNTTEEEHRLAVILAAAPDLLATLKDAVFHLQRFSDDRASRPCYDRAMKLINTIEK